MFRFFLRFLFLLAAAITTVSLFAQDNLQREKPQMAEAMRSEGKIYVVVAVLLIILTGIFIYLVRLDRKMNRLEKKS